MKLKEWLFPEECLEYESWERLYCIKENVKTRIKEKVSRKVKKLGLKNDHSENLSSHLPSSISL